jgi:serine/threonine-protein kinase RsbW
VTGQRAATVRHLDVPAARLEDLAAVRAFVTNVCREAAASTDVREALVLAADEVCSNIVRHAYPRDAPGPVRFDVSIAEAAVLTITDEARPFDPTDVPAPDFGAPVSTRAIGGLGIYLVRKMMDDLRYERRPTGNRVTLMKRLRPAQAPNGEP